MPKLKNYETHQKEVVPETEKLPSGVACTEPKCKGEMMIQVPHQGHYSSGRKGEPGAIKTDLLRAICGECGWLGWV